MATIALYEADAVDAAQSSSNAAVSAYALREVPTVEDVSAELDMLTRDSDCRYVLTGRDGLIYDHSAVLFVVLVYQD